MFDKGTLILRFEMDSIFIELVQVVIILQYHSIFLHDFALNYL